MTGMGEASCHTCHLDSLRRPAAILQSKEDPILFACVRNVRQQEGEPSARDPTSTGRGEFRSLRLQAHTLHFFQFGPCSGHPAHSTSGNLPIPYVCEHSEGVRERVSKNADDCAGVVQAESDPEKCHEEVVWLRVEFLSLS